MGGGQRPSQTFFRKKVWTCFKGGGGGQRASSKVVFCKKVCFGVPEELLCVKIIYILHASKHELQYHIPTQALSEKLRDVQQRAKGNKFLQVITSFR